MNRNQKIILAIIVSLSFLVVPSASVAQFNAHETVHPQQTTIKLGGLFPLSGRLAGGGVERRAAAQMAIDQINANTSFLSNVKLELLVKDTKTDPATGTTVANEAISAGVVGIIGAASSSVSKAIATVAAQKKIPQISYSSTSPSLSDKQLYPYFMRVVPPDSQQGSALAHIIQNFKFTDIATISTSDDYGLGGIGVVENVSKTLGINVATKQRFTPGAADVTTQLQAIKDSGAKVIVINTVIQDAITVFSQMSKVGISPKNGYTWFGTDGPTQEAVFANDTKIKDALQGMVGTAPNRGSGSSFDAFVNLWKTCNGKTSTDYAGCGDTTPNTYAPFAYDAVYAFAHAIDKMLKANQAVNDGAKLLETLKGLKFQGATGLITFDKNGDRIGDYNVLNLQGTVFKVVGIYNLNTGLKLTGTITWGTGNTAVPSYAKLGGAPGFELPMIAFGLISIIAIIRFRKREN